MNRRTVLAAGSLGVAALGGGCAGVPVRPAQRRPLGLADLTVIKPLAQDYAGTLRSVAAMGYTHFGFRLAGYSPADQSELPPAEKAKLIRAAGLEIGVVRYGYGRDFATQAKEAAAKAGEAAAKAGEAAKEATKDAAQATADAAGKAADAAKDATAKAADATAKAADASKEAADKAVQAAKDAAQPKK